MSAEVITTSPCPCCRDLLHPASAVYFDEDLQQYVCNDCRQNLRAATAWLKKSGMPQCLRTAA